MTLLLSRAKLAPLGALFAGMFLLLTLGGCASQRPGLYDWGSYETQVYAYFNNSGSPEQQIAALEQRLQTNSSRSPPGYHAHLGLLYGKVGRVADMQQQFNIEKSLFPEAAPFMDFLLRNSAKPTLSTP